MRKTKENRFNQRTKYFYFLLLIFHLIAVDTCFSQSFWSPREIVLDVYTQPIPFKYNGEKCIAYELHITNMDKKPVSVHNIEIKTKESKNPLKIYCDELLEQSLSLIGSKKNDTSQLIYSGQRAILHAFLCYQNNQETVENIYHTVSYSFQQEGLAAHEISTSGGELIINNHKKAIVLGPIFSEGIWFAGRGVADVMFGHRKGAIRPQNGIPFQKARYAIDFIKIDKNGNAYENNLIENENWFSYNSEVLAVADGYVESVQDGIPDLPPNVPGGSLSERLSLLSINKLAGNYIVLNLGNETYALYGHLKKGSIYVQEGDVVKKGQVIGRVGNSGNSDLPHLHFQINRKIPIKGEAVPFIFEEFELIGNAEKFNPYHKMFGEMITSHILDREQNEPGNVSNISMTNSLNYSIKSSIEKEFKPSWVKDMNSKKERRKFEMPVTESFIRFIF